MSTDKMRVLEMIQEGKVTAAEGMELIMAMEENPDRTAAGVKDKCFRIRVSGDKTKKVNVNIPVRMVKAFSKLAVYGMKFIPDEAKQEMEKKGIDLTSMDIEALMHAVSEGLVDEKLVDIDVEDPDEGRIKVEIYVE